MQSKRVNGHKYYLFGKYYSHLEAYENALKIRRKLEELNEKKFRYFIEEITSFGDLDELLFPGVKHYLWVNKL